MRIPKTLLVAIPIIFIFSAVVVMWGPGPKPRPEIRVYMIAVKAERSNPEDIERAQQKITEVYESLEQGESFKKVAREESEATSSFQDGEMGWRGRGTLPEHHEDIAFQLKPGQYSEIIGDKTPDYLIYRILYVEERRNF